MNTSAIGNTCPPANDAAWLDLHDLKRKTKLSKSTLYILMAAGKLPRPFKVGKSSRWKSTAINAWMTEQEAAAQQ